jgi:nicotinate-nucleotide adenylyltransferase
MRIAFFGGSFDPPHRGHVTIARAAADRFALDQVLWAPVGRQPLKNGLAMASYEDRLAMVRVASSVDRRFAPCELDQPKHDGSHNYTYETLSTLKTQLLAVDDTTRLFCLLGADSFHTLAHWHHAADLLLLCDFIVAARPGYDLNQAEKQLPAGIAVVGRPDAGELQLASAESPAATTTLHLMLDLEEDVSATVLRQALAQGDTAASDRMLPAGVPAYIREHGLYRELR